MTFFEMFGTVTLPVPVKSWLSIPLPEVHLLCKFVNVVPREGEI